MGRKKREVGYEVEMIADYAARDRRRFIRGTFIINLSPAFFLLFLQYWLKMAGSLFAAVTVEWLMITDTIC